MNRQCFRVIFSKTLQRLVVVSELAKADGKAESESTASGGILQKICKIRPLVFSLFCAFGFVSFAENASAETLIITQSDQDLQLREVNNEQGLIKSILGSVQLATNSTLNNNAGEILAK